MANRVYQFIKQKRAVLGRHTVIPFSSQKHRIKLPQYINLNVTLKMYLIKTLEDDSFMSLNSLNTKHFIQSGKIYQVIVNVKNYSARTEFSYKCLRDNKHTCSQKSLALSL